MDKVLIVISDNNKGKFISKGFSKSFHELNYFVYEKKTYDLNIEEINKIKPDIVMIFWTDMSQKEQLIEFFKNYEFDIIHLAELKSDIPKEFYNKKNNFIFSFDSKTQNHILIPSINVSEYKTKFNDYKYNITFAGNPAYPKREIILSKIILNFGPINLFCRSFDFYKSLDEIYKNKYLDEYFLELYKNSYRGYVENQKELSQIYSSSKINLDMENENKKSINYRIIEIAASGGFIIAPDNDIIKKQFESGYEIETYKTTDDLIDKINFYLKNVNIAQSIAAKGKKAVIGNYNNTERLKSILKAVYGKNISNR